MDQEYQEREEKQASDPQNFWYWIRERHRIYEKKTNGEPWPWTNDEILQKYRFCNVFRELDSVTIWIRENWREPYADHENLWFAMAVARQINWPDTLEWIGFPDFYPPDSEEKWFNRARNIIRDRIAAGEKAYTGAYMLTGTLGGPKEEQTIFKILRPLWHKREIVAPIPWVDNLQSAFRKLKGNAGFQGFLSYEVITDLRHTRYLRDADDIYTWANAGPGARRGLNRFYGRPLNFALSEAQCVAEMRALLGISKQVLDPKFPPLEMRDIEHSLCEYDKYERARLGEGRPRATYRRPD